MPKQKPSSTAMLKPALVTRHSRAVGNTVSIDADSSHTAVADAFGLAAAPNAAVSVVFGEAYVGGATRAYGDGTLNVNATSMSVTAKTRSHPRFRM